MPYYSLLSADPKEEERYPASPIGRRLLTTLLLQQEEDFLLVWQQPSQSETVTTQPMKSH